MKADIVVAKVVSDDEDDIRRVTASIRETKQRFHRDNVEKKKKKIAAYATALLHRCPFAGIS